MIMATTEYHIYLDDPQTTSVFGRLLSTYRWVPLSLLFQIFFIIFDLRDKTFFCLIFQTKKLILQTFSDSKL